MGMVVGQVDQLKGGTGLLDGLFCLKDAPFPAPGVLVSLGALPLLGGGRGSPPGWGVCPSGSPPWAGVGPCLGWGYGEG